MLKLLVVIVVTSGWIRAGTSCARGVYFTGLIPAVDAFTYAGTPTWFGGKWI
ncbi:hypothetical protein [Natronosalvus halobius]|uniref:hypothetical protein n=1 Tax=Natronosalvus halobius TaxID=2953746 RepID=UPI00209DCC58|nr:hypothetical protein [Natronosalvus halobius]USZ73568.1 hypothetical protein NGM15_18075 [Natronosalvus halobius]